MAAARTRSRFDREPESRPQNDAYVGLLALSLLALIASCILLWIDYSQYGGAKPPAVTIPPPAGPRELPGGGATGALAPAGDGLPVAAALVPAPTPVVPAPVTPDIQPVSATLAAPVTPPAPAPAPAPEPTPVPALATPPAAAPVPVPAPTTPVADEKPPVPAPPAPAPAPKAEEPPTGPKLDDPPPLPNGGFKVPPE